MSESKMKFCEAFQLLREGKRISRPIFAMYFSIDNLNDYRGTYLSDEDIKADDWEIVE